MPNLSETAKKYLNPSVTPQTVDKSAVVSNNEALNNRLSAIAKKYMAGGTTNTEVTPTMQRFNTRIGMNSFQTNDKVSGSSVSGYTPTKVRTAEEIDNDLAIEQQNYANSIRLLDRSEAGRNANPFAQNSAVNAQRAAEASRLKIQELKQEKRELETANLFAEIDSMDNAEIDTLSYKGSQDKKNPLSIAKSRQKTGKLAVGDIDTGYYNRLLSMTNDQQTIYNALYAKDSTKADKYLEFLENNTDLNEKAASKAYEAVGDNAVLKSAASFGSGVVEGTKGMTTNLKDFVTGDATVKKNSANEILTTEIREDTLDENGNTTAATMWYDILNSTGNMTPGIVASLIVPGSAGQVLSSTVFALSQTGNAYREAINGGHTVDQARAYATQQGVDEELTNLFLGGIGSFGGGLGKKMLGNTKLGKSVVSAFDKLWTTERGKALANYVVKYLTDAGSEACQEFLQYFTEGFGKKYLLGEDFDIDMGDAAYSAAVGALNAMGLNLRGVASTANQAANTKTGEEVESALTKFGNDYDAQTTESGKAKALKNEADYVKKTNAMSDFSTLPEETSAYATEELAEKAKKLKKFSEETNAKTEKGKKVDLLDKATYNKLHNDFLTSLNETRTDGKMSDNAFDSTVEILSKGFGEEGAKKFKEEADKFRGKSDEVFQLYKDFQKEYNENFNENPTEEVKTDFSKRNLMTAEEVKAVRESAKADWGTNKEETQRRIDALQTTMEEDADGKFRSGIIDKSGVNLDNISEDERAQLVIHEAAISKGLGMNVKLVEAKADENGDYDIDTENGAYDFATNTMTLDIHAGAKNVNEEARYANIISHELTHWMEMYAPSLYQNVKNTVFTENPEGMNDRIAAEIERQKSNKAEKGTRNSAISEIVARSCEDMLGNSKTYRGILNKLDAKTRREVQKHINELGKNMSEYFDDILKKYDSNSAEAKALRANEKAFNKVISEWDAALNLGVENTKKGIQPLKLKKAVDHVDKKKELEKAFASDEVSKRDDVLKQLSYRGAGTATKADKSRIELAKEMLDSGVESEKVRLATGWFKGYDGKWRTEVDDSGAKLKTEYIPQDTRDTYLAFEEAYNEKKKEHEAVIDEMNSLADDKTISNKERGERYKELVAEEISTEKEMNKAYDALRRAEGNNLVLSDILEHDKLFKVYPKLKNLKVEFTYTGKDGTVGTSYGNSISIAVDRPSNEILSTVMHEVQHEIQRVEGFASGSTPEYWKGKLLRDDEEVKKAASKVNDLAKKLKGIEYHGYGMGSPIQTSISYVYALSRIVNEKLSNEGYEFYKEKIKDYESRAESQGYLPLMKEYYDSYLDFEMAKREVEQVSGEEAYNKYLNTAGEIESRDVQKRLNLSKADRKKTRPDIDRNNVEFVENATDRDVQKSFSRRDTDYSKAVESNDMDTAQRLVDEAAKESGYNTKVFHGSTKEFNKFENLSEYLNGYFYFTPNKRWARNFVKETTGSKTPSVKEYFINEGKSLDASNETYEKTASEWFNFFEKNGIKVTDEMRNNYRGSASSNPNQKMPLWSLIQYDFIDGEYKTDYQKAFKDAGYESIHMPDTVRGSGRWAEAGDTYVVFDASQAKSADPVTYDDNGNAIPLSERFNSSNDDIRYSRRGETNFTPLEEIANPKEAYEKAAKDYRNLIHRKLSDKEREAVNVTSNYYKAREQKVKASTEATKTAEKLMKAAKRLNKMKGDEAFEKAKESILGDISLTTMHLAEGKALKLEKLKEEIRQQNEIDPHYSSLDGAKAEKLVSDLDKKHIKDLTREEMSELLKQISALTTAKQTYDKEIREENAKTFAELGREGVRQQGEVKGISNDVDAYKLNMLNPTRALPMLDGYAKDGVFTRFADELNDGQTKEARFKMDTERMFHDIDNNQNLLKDFSKQNIPVDTLNGRVYISKGMRMALYMHSLNKDNLRHIAKGGLTIPDEAYYKKGDFGEAYTRGKTVKLVSPPAEGEVDTSLTQTRAKLEEIFSKMSAEEKEYCEIAYKFFNEVTKSAINEVSIQLNGYDIATVDNYFPIRTDKNFRKADLDAMINGDASLEGMGMLKERNGSSLPILLEDITKVVLRQKNNTAAYYGLAIPVRNFTSFYNYTSRGYRNSFKSAFGEKWGKKGQDYVENMIRDLQFGRGNEQTDFIDKAKSVYAGSVLNWNLSVAIKQSASYPFAASVIGWKPLATALGKKFTESDRTYMDSITPWGYMRRTGFSGTEMGEVAKQRTGIENNQTWQKFKTATNFIQQVDVATTEKLFKATEEWVKQNHPDLEVRGVEYSQILADKYNEMLQKTQPSYDVMQRNEFLRRPTAGTKVLGMFKTQTFNMGGELIDAIEKYKAVSKKAKSDESYKEDAKSAGKHLKTTVVSTLASQSMLAVLTTVSNAVLHKMKPYRDDDEELTEESIASKVAYDFGTSFAGLFFGGSEVQTALIALYNAAVKGESWSDFDNLDYPGLELYNNTMESITDLTKSIHDCIAADKDERDASKVIKASATAVINGLKLKGIPAENLYNLANAMYLWGVDFKNDELGTFNAGNGLLGVKDTSISQTGYAKQALKYYAEGNTKMGDEKFRQAKNAGYDPVKVNNTMESILKEDGDLAQKVYDNGGNLDMKDVSAKAMYLAKKPEDAKKTDKINTIESLDISDEDKGYLYNDVNESDMFTEWTNSGGEAYDYMMGQKLATEIESAEPDNVWKYVNDSSYTDEEKSAWLHSSKQRIESEKYTSWNGTDADYIKHKANLESFVDDKETTENERQIQVVAYIKEQPEDIWKDLWLLAGYKESTYEKNFSTTSTKSYKLAAPKLKTELKSVELKTPALKLKKY